VRDAVALSEAGVAVPQLNLATCTSGGSQAGLPSVFLDAGELAALEKLSRAGTQVEVRAVPSEPPLRLPDLKARFAAA